MLTLCCPNSSPSSARRLGRSSMVTIISSSMSQAYYFGLRGAPALPAVAARPAPEGVHPGGRTPVGRPGELLPGEVLQDLELGEVPLVPQNGGTDEVARLIATLEGDLHLQARCEGDAFHREETGQLMAALPSRDSRLRRAEILSQLGLAEAGVHPGPADEVADPTGAIDPLPVLSPSLPEVLEFRRLVRLFETFSVHSLILATTRRRPL